MLLLFGAFVAGLLTVLAPCILPLLPIIIGGSVTGDVKDRKRPLIIALSLAVSLILFTLLLKATTLLINIPPQAITYFSGGIIIGLGLLLLFPSLYAIAIAKLGIEQRAQKALGKGFSNKSSLVGPIITGAALGPVFSSCSPVYAYILATVLPVNFGQAFAYIIAYVLGLTVILLLIGYYGQRFISKIKFASDPKGAFQKILAVIFILVGILIATGYDKRAQTWVSQHTPFNFDALSAQLLPEGVQKEQAGILNVEPYAAPEFVGLENWINSEPLTLKGLEGKVVLVDFWTYSCINCIRNNPYIERWYQMYKDQGFTVVGVHAPEFAFEKIPANVQKGVRDQKLTYPVALDNDFSTWNAFQNQYWPAGYLIDAQGQVRRVHYGEGEYAESENAIRALLKENGVRLSEKRSNSGSEVVPTSKMETPETYLGSKRAGNFVGSSALAAKPVQTFVAVQDLKPNQWTLGGTWETQSEKIIARGNSVLRFRIASKEAYVVAASTSTQSIGVKLDGKPISQTPNAGQDVRNSLVPVKEAKLYRLVSNPAFDGDYTLELTVPDGVELNVFTFGS